MYVALIDAAGGTRPCIAGQVRIPAGVRIAAADLPRSAVIGSVAGLPPGGVIRCPAGGTPTTVPRAPLRRSAADGAAGNPDGSAHAAGGAGLAGACAIVARDASRALVGRCVAYPGCACAVPVRGASHAEAAGRGAGRGAWSAGAVVVSGALRALIGQAERLRGKAVPGK